MTSYRLSFVEQLSLILVALSTLISLLLFSMPVTLGVGIGGALAVANFYALRRLMSGIFNNSERPPRQIAMTLLLMVKFGLLGGVLYLVLTYVPVNGLALLFGVSLVVLSIFVEGFRTAIREASASRSGDETVKQ